MLTSPLIDLLTDPNLFLRLPHSDPRVRPRNTRAMYVVALVGGSFIGAAVHRKVGTEWVMWVSVMLRVGVLGWVACLGGVDDETKKGLMGGRTEEEGKDEAGGVIVVESERERVVEGSRREKEPKGEGQGARV